VTRAFRLYLAGQLPSVVCSWAQVIAVTVVTVHLNPGALGWIVAAQFVPSLVLGPYFGVIADRHDRRRLLVLAEAGLGVVAIGYSLAYFVGALTLPTLFALATAWGVLNALDTPARRALIPALMPDAPARSSALSGVVMLIGMTAGSALGGWLVASSGAGVVFVVNAGSFALDVAVLGYLARLVPKVTGISRAPGQMREGVRYVVTTPFLRAPMAALAVIGTLTTTFQVSIPLFMTKTFGGGAATIGTAFAAVSAGSLAGALATAARPPRGSVVVPSAGLLAACCAAVALSPNVAWALVGLVAVGVCWSVYLTSTIATLQQADPTFLGRLMSLFAVLLIGSTPIGGPIASALASSVGARAPFVLAAAAAAVGCALVAAAARPATGAPARSRRTSVPGWSASARLRLPSRNHVASARHHRP